MSCLNPFNQYLYGFNTTLVVHQRRVQHTPVRYDKHMLVSHSDCNTDMMQFKIITCVVSKMSSLS